MLLSLAEHLDSYGSPIDYQRRRQLFVTPTDDLTTGKDWQHICDQAGIVAGHRNHLHACRYLIEDLAGHSPFDLPIPVALPPGDGAASYHRFCQTMTPVVAHLLHAHATWNLEKHDIDEPLSWEPSPEWAPAQTTWPSPTTDLDRHALTDLLVHQRLPLSKIAAQLGTSIDHIRVFLRAQPLGAPPRHRAGHQRPNQASCHTPDSSAPNNSATATSNSAGVGSASRPTRAAQNEQSKPSDAAPASPAGPSDADRNWKSVANGSNPNTSFEKERSLTSPPNSASAPRLSAEPPEPWASQSEAGVATATPGPGENAPHRWPHHAGSNWPTRSRTVTER